MVLGAAAAAAVALQCTTVVGLDDLEFSGAGAMQPTGGGGVGGGTGGTSTGTGGSATGTGGSSTGTGGTSTGAGGEGSGGGPAAPCHPSGLTDGFDGPSLSTSLWAPYTAAGASMGVEGGVGFIELPGGSAGAAYAEIVTLAFYNLTECTVWVELVAPFPASALAALTFEVWSGNQNFAQITIAEGAISFLIRVSGAATADDTLQLDPTAHRWLRFRDHAGSLSLETSPDGISWSQRVSAPSPSWIDQVHIGINGGSWETLPDVARAQFDNLNLLP